jgi:antitoxin component YwqK of YwqJK toxin-antitoxin module
MKVFISALFLFSVFFFTGCEGPSFGSKKVHKEYFTNGTLRSEFIMTDKTKKNGTLKKYSTDGKLTSVVKIKNGVKIGTEIMYDPQGRVLMRTPYVNGVKHGNQTVYYPNQTVLATIPYKYDRKNGVAVKYFPDGSIQQKAQFKNDRIIN